MSEIKKPNSQTLAVADKVGSFIEYFGFKEVHGKVWTLTFLSETPVDANYLIDNLKISKALVSMTIKDLLYYNVILEVEKDRPGTQKYKINPDITNVILDVIRKRELVMLEEIQSDVTKLQGSNDGSSNLSKERSQELQTMVDAAYLLLQGMVAGSLVDFTSFEKVMTVSE